MLEVQIFEIFFRAPDGTCLLTCSNDNVLRLYNLPEDKPSTEQQEKCVAMVGVMNKEANLLHTLTIIGNQFYVMYPFSRVMFFFFNKLGS